MAANQRGLALVQVEAHDQGCVVGRCDALPVGLLQRHRTARLGLANLRVRRTQELVHHAGPGLLLDLDERLQFAQMVGVAQSM